MERSYEYNRTYGSSQHIYRWDEMEPKYDKISDNLNCIEAGLDAFGFLRQERIEPFLVGESVDPKLTRYK